MDAGRRRMEWGRCSSGGNCLVSATPMVVLGVAMGRGQPSGLAGLGLFTAGSYVCLGGVPCYRSCRNGNTGATFQMEWLGQICSAATSQTLCLY